MNGKELLERLLEPLLSLYDKSEARSIAYLVLDDKFELDKAAVVAAKEIEWNSRSEKDFKELLDRLLSGEPVQYISGKTEFCGLELKVDPAVLIPRPETEELVELIKSKYKSPPLVIADLGTGSGCIALALKHYFNASEVYGLDNHNDALAVAKTNGKALSLPVNWVLGNMLDLPLAAFPLTDLLVSNPPYVSPEEKAEMHANVLEHEPQHAIFAPEADPILFYRAIARQMGARCKPGSEIFLEINPRHVDHISATFKQHGAKRIQVIKDLSGKMRFMKIKVPER